MNIYGRMLWPVITCYRHPILPDTWYKNLKTQLFARQISQFYFLFCLKELFSVFTEYPMYDLVSHDGLIHLQFTWLQMQSLTQHFPHYLLWYTNFSVGAIRRFPLITDKTRSHSFIGFVAHGWPVTLPTMPYRTLSLIKAIMSVVHIMCARAFSAETWATVSLELRRRLFFFFFTKTRTFLSLHRCKYTFCFHRTSAKHGKVGY